MKVKKNDILSLVEKYKRWFDYSIINWEKIYREEKEAKEEQSYLWDEFFYFSMKSCGTCSALVRELISYGNHKTMKGTVEDNIVKALTEMEIEVES